jgi:hypothetical protein
VRAVVVISDSKKGQMGFFDVFKKKPSGEVTQFRNEKELKAFLLAATHDERVSELLVEVATNVGRDGYLEITFGGNGQPYSVEYTACPDDSRKSSEVRAEYQELKNRIAAAADAEWDQLERKQARLVGGICTLRINTFSTVEFERQRALILKTWTQCKSIWNRTP